MDPDQTAPTVYETSKSLMDDKNLHFVIMRFKG